MSDFLEDFGAIVLAVVIAIYVLLGTSLVCFSGGVNVASVAKVFIFILCILCIVVGIVKGIKYYESKNELLSLYNKAMKEVKCCGYNSSCTNDVISNTTNEQIYINKIHKLKNEINNVTTKNKIGQIELLLEEIFNYIKNDKVPSSKVDKLTSYYLPTVIKILESYKKAEQQKFKTPNILKILSETESFLNTIVDSLEKLLDDIYQIEALDISSDLVVMDTMFINDGLKKDKLSVDCKESVYQKKTSPLPSGLDYIS